MRTSNHKKIDLTQETSKLLFKNNTLYCTDLFFNHKVELFSGIELSEADVDTKTVSTLRDLGWEEFKEIRQQKTGIAEIDKIIKSNPHKKNRSCRYLYLNE